MADHTSERTNLNSADSPVNRSEEVEQNAGARTAEVNRHPEKSLEEARNANEGEGSNASGGPAPSTAEEHVPSTSDPEATDLPTMR